ncbi:MAG: cation:proton antiporter [Lentisphaeraceae bacterium]|nr:cation:proton antiporter [Lentisphaeraceae bacterium]
MLLTIATLLFCALLLGAFMEKIKLPALLGFMLTGLIFSPYSADFLNLSPSFLKSLFLTNQQTAGSSDIRNLALFIILFRAGLGRDRSGLKENGAAAIRLSIIPALTEATLVTLGAHFLFHLPLIDAALLGFVIAAVSPAVIVPQMLELQEKGLGSNKNIPTLILASATVDDIIAISGFGICLSLISTANAATTDWRLLLIQVPLSLITGVTIGYYITRPLIRFLKASHLHAAFRACVLLGVAILLKEIDNRQLFPFSYLITIMTMGVTLRLHDHDLAEDISKQLTSLWKIAEIALFVLIGAMVDIDIALSVGVYGILIIAIGLTARSIGVWISLLNTKLNYKERLFCVLAFLPKATVQATIGGLALTLFYNGKISLHEGRATGDLILAMAALSIIITAPLGAMAIRLSRYKLLEQSK